jgi:hypothetical protein
MMQVSISLARATCLRGMVQGQLTSELTKVHAALVVQHQAQIKLQHTSLQQQQNEMRARLDEVALTVWARVHALTLVPPTFPGVPAHVFLTLASR